MLKKFHERTAFRLFCTTNHLLKSKNGNSALGVQVCGTLHILSQLPSLPL